MYLFLTPVGPREDPGWNLRDLPHSPNGLVFDPGEAPGPPTRELLIHQEDLFLTPGFENNSPNGPSADLPGTFVAKDNHQMDPLLAPGNHQMDLFLTFGEALGSFRIPKKTVIQSPNGPSE